MQYIIEYFNNGQNQRYIVVISITLLCLVVLSAVIVFCYKRSGEKQDENDLIDESEEKEMPENIVDEEVQSENNSIAQSTDDELMEIAEDERFSVAKTKTKVRIITLSDLEKRKTDTEQDELYTATENNKTESTTNIGKPTDDIVFSSEEEWQKTDAETGESINGETTAPSPKGEWVIVEESSNKYCAYLTTTGGEKIIKTEIYTSLSGIKSGIDTLKKNIEKGNYAISLDKDGNFIFKIFTSANRLLCTGGGFSTRIQCEKAFLFVKNISNMAKIIEKK